MEKAIRDYILDNSEEHSNCLLLGGARQVGKTTLVEQITKEFNAVTINLYERPTLARSIDAVESFDALERLFKRELNFEPSQGVLLVIDEAQEARRLGQWIRFFKEKWRRQKVIVLGSILTNLFGEGVSYPVGRVEELVLRPFTFKEFLLADGREGLIEIMEAWDFQHPLSEEDHRAYIGPYLDYLRTGGMPEIVIAHGKGHENISTLIDRLIGQYAIDIERHMEEIYRTMFVSSLKRIAETTCHSLKRSQIISTDSASYRKLPRLLEVMEKWHLVHRISVQTKHPESASGIASKRYLFDVGLTNFFINHGTAVEWVERTESGNTVFAKLIENFICNEIMASHPAPMTNFNYYRDTRNSREVDFIIPINNTTVPVEVKSGARVSRNTLLPMISFLEYKGADKGVLIYSGEAKQLRLKGKKITAIPPFMISEIGRLLSSLHPSQM
ncbi:MAG: hypothetical protein A3H42_01155 [Deltaproteobacteria bacterium RIFCSPLOWO2_02_FULL_46_8]|nr:MAG: hypothetical protein A3H42_01155 [Deltaproteobacteria bacterium RIFCSPLOWO2_02_FULL_46_8]